MGTPTENNPNAIYAYKGTNLLLYYEKDVGYSVAPAVEQFDPYYARLARLMHDNEKKQKACIMHPKRIRGVLEKAFLFPTSFPLIGTSKSLPRSNFEIANSGIKPAQLRAERRAAEKKRKNVRQAYPSRTAQLALRRNVVKGFKIMSKIHPGVFPQRLLRHRHWTRARITKKKPEKCTPIHLMGLGKVQKLLQNTEPLW